MHRNSTLAALGRVALTLSLTLAASSAANAAQVRVTVTNLAPDLGTFLTPVWLGFHDGDFDLYDLGAPAAQFVERVAEDGDTGPVTSAFQAAGYSAQTTLTSGGSAPVFAPGASNSAIFDLDPSRDRFLSFLSMVIPSNDAFIGNGNPTGHEIFDASGNFLGHDFVFFGSMVRDAGTEVNDEIPGNTAFLAQTAPNTGVDENGVITIHPGFLPGGTILSDSRFVNADFRAAGYQIARIQVSAVPIPAAFPLLLGGLVMLGGRFRTAARPR